MSDLVSKGLDDADLVINGLNESEVLIVGVFDALSDAVKEGDTVDDEVIVILPVVETVREGVSEFAGEMEEDKESGGLCDSEELPVDEWEIKELFDCATLRDSDLDTAGLVEHDIVSLARELWETVALLNSVPVVVSVPGGLPVDE